MKKSVGLNAVINGFKTILSLIFPLITYPYITRVLQVEAIGQYNFSRSFVNYFYLIAALGVSTYAIREGAQYRDDRERLSKFASDIFSINIFSTIISYLLLYIVIFLSSIVHQNSAIIYILSISMVFTTLGCEWILSIYEEYLYIAIRTIVCLLLSLILMFLFVKTKNDVKIYAAIIVLSQSGANIVNYFEAKKRCNIRFRRNRDALIHLRPIFVLCASSIATTVYVNSDIVVLGFMSSDYHVGIYTISSKVYSIIKQALSAMIIVSIPRFSWLIGQNDIEGYNRLANKIINVLITLVFPCAVGLFALSKNVILTVSTMDYITAVIPLRILCVALLFCMFTWFFTSCILIPHRMEKCVLISTIVAASTNVILNIILIPYLHESAAALTTVIAEATSFIICYIKSRNLARLRINLNTVLSIIVGSIVVYGICVAFNRSFDSYFIAMVCAFIVSVPVYAGILKMFRNQALEYATRMIKRNRM